jgi:hypothetical protein
LITLLSSCLLDQGFLKFHILFTAISSFIRLSWPV